MSKFLTGETRKRRFADQLLQHTTRQLGFIDVGSGGPLKKPWSLMPLDRLQKYDVEPLGGDENQLPTCISDRNGRGTFNVAEDPRASSLHKPNAEFIERHGQSGLAVRKVIDVNLRTLSDAFGHLRQLIDVMDVNVEGHDNQVLLGAGDVFANNFIKLVKVEYELTEVWSGQSWFGEVDGTMRARGFDLAALTVDYSQPMNARGLRCGAEPIWGKAIYVPKRAAWLSQGAHINGDDCRFAIALYALFDLPSRALDVASMASALRSGNPAIGGIPTVEELRSEFFRLYGETPLPLRAVKTLWRTFPRSVRERLQPLVDRLA